MKVLIVCSGNAPNFDFQKHQAFIYDQVEAVKRADSSIEFDYFFISGKGLKGYLRSLKELKKKLKAERYYCIHAHVAASALLANLQREVPVVATFHGSDINDIRLRCLSLWVELLSKKTIYVSEQLLQKAFFYFKHKAQVIPCGVDFGFFFPRPKEVSKAQMGFLPEKKHILFSSSFDNTVKNYPLAAAALSLINNPNLQLLELKGYDREEVAVLLTAVDAALMTSHTEGSPQFIKEAIACGCPVVSTDVGDVKSVIENIQGCFITSRQPEDVASKIRQALNYPTPINGRERIQRFDNELIAKKIISLYQSIT
ncbi:glycosyltransferase family 4 protein [Runella aurantiaca]|uniref:Glycosyltransferase n=1 Tax=Runella aurantiaca TaxID=2282308 RepID=A0A369I5Z0_9BACT|nr:glycosyltransferase family 4 protein [Runella aurantiaca]RDB04320.1 glycosyltransferase [Runella aurantiaca]